MSRFWKIAVVFSFLGRVACQASGNELNTSMCNWLDLRANVIRNTVYLDGGELFWQNGYSNGQYASPSSDGNVEGLVYTLDLGEPFDPTTNLTGLFKSMSKTGSAVGSSNLAPNYVDGVMFANYDELILYGGMTQVTDSSPPPAANSIWAYEAYQYGPPVTPWAPGFVIETLPNVTRYITNGAGVSAPSANLGFYFSGMRAADWGLIQNGDESANTLANTLITVDMSVMRHETWMNETLPPHIPARVNAELVWVPVSQSGILIAIGGVLYSASLTAAQALTEEQAAASNKTSPTYMSTVSVYDIATKQWYLQNTTGDIPPQLTMFCSVVAAASDGSSYNIYIYGGYDGVDVAHTPSDDVYVLSVPSFTWIQVYSGQPLHGRSGHKCIMAYPNQMFVLGGVAQGDQEICLSENAGGIIQVFNLNTPQFQDSYNPETWSNYTVPSLVTGQIGGNGQGGATKTAPPTWINSSLATVFQSKYTGAVQTFYPYALVNATSSPTPTPTPTGPISIQNNGNGFPSWAGAVIGVVLGLAIVVGGVIIFRIINLRRNARMSYGSVNDSHRGSNMRSIVKWLYGMPADPVVVPHRASELGATEKEPSETVASPSEIGFDAREADSSAVHELEASGSFELPTRNSFNDNNRRSGHNPSPSLDSILHAPVHAMPIEGIDMPGDGLQSRPLSPD